MHAKKAFGSRQGNSYRHVIIAVVFGAVMFVAFWPRTSVDKQDVVAPGTAKPVAAATEGKEATKKVEIILNVMSQCPDARFCQTAFQRITANISSLVLLRTEYIATLIQDEQDVACMHGPNECTGNKLQLCLQESVPAEHNRDWFFAALLCHANGSVADQAHLKTCMGDAGMPAEVQDKVLACASGPQGLQLQIASAKKIKENQVVKSCTVFIDGKKRCIRDGGRYYDCPGGDSDAAFTKTICEAHKAASGSAAPECAASLKSGA